MKTYYSDYAQHCLRFYCRHHAPVFHSDADKKNWNACDKAMKTLNDEQRQIVMSIYEGGDTVANNVYKTAERLNCKQDALWPLIADLERRVAKKRGLL